MNVWKKRYGLMFFFFFFMLFMLINMLLNILLRVKEFFKTKQPEIQRNIEELSGKS